MTSRPVTSDALKHYNFLAQHGRALLDNGYHIVPIAPGRKAPGFDGWEKSRATKDQLKDWLENGHKMAGVGILTKDTPAIDIDIRDERVAMLMDKYVREKLGGTLVRIGQAPKRLFVFRTDTPFRKMRTTIRFDEWGEKQQIEVLAEGQQFVAYHKHPDTGKPYDWPDFEENPLDVKANELPTITVEQIEGLLAYFEEVADSEEWEVKKGARLNAKPIDTENPFAEDTAPVDLSDDEIRKRLMLVPGNDEYDTWSQVGMALYHQWDGGEPGLSFWHEWSEPANNYDHDSLERHWDSFSIQGKKRAPVTVRLILKLSAEAVMHTNAELGQKLRLAFAAATNVVEWDKAAKETRKSAIDPLVRSSIAQLAKDSRDRITGTKTSLVEIKKTIAYKVENPKTPGWAKNWVYNTAEDKFFNVESKVSVSMQGFNAMYDRQALTEKDIVEGRSAPSAPAADLALRVYQIETVQGTRYEPGRDAIFHEFDGAFANTYTEKEIPEPPSKKIPRDQKNVQRVKAHIKHLITDPREQTMFLDWISWIVQNPGKHVNYALLLQGVEGDGKSFWAELLREVMGMSNVTMLNASTFESNFSDWAVGQCLACVEEVRLIKAQNKYEVLNKVKPNIANTYIEIHPKGRAIYNALNTTSYFLLTNYKDALPLDDDGRRYLVIFSQWQRKAVLDVFKNENPEYYADLYTTIAESAGAIREWLLNHEQSDGFNAKGDAPVTAAKMFMIKQAKPEFIITLEDIIRENSSLFADEDLIDVTNLSQVFHDRGVDYPHAKTLASMLQRAGYEELGQVRLDEGARASFWSKTPENFRSATNGSEVFTDSLKIRRHRKDRESELDDEI